MSVRRKDDSKAQVQALQKELEELKSRAQEADRADNVAASLSEGETPSAAFDALTPVEQSAASLGVHPEAWKPIGFMVRSELNLSCNYDIPHALTPYPLHSSEQCPLRDAEEGECPGRHPRQAHRGVPQRGGGLGVREGIVVSCQNHNLSFPDQE